MLTRPWLLASLVAVLAGCGGGVTNRLLYRGGAIPPVSQDNLYGIAKGVGIRGVVPGVNDGYYITANEGGSFRLVWTGDSSVSGALRHFTGSIWTSGSFTSWSEGCIDASCPLESGDFVSRPVNLAEGQRIDWDTFAADGLDGFDFVVNKVPVYFNLLIEDQPAQLEIIYFPASAYGGDIAHSGAIPFGLLPE